MNNFKKLLENLQEEVVTRKKHRGIRKRMRPIEKRRAKKRKKAKKLLNIEPGSPYKLSIDPNTKKYIKVRKTPSERRRKIKTIG